MPHIRRMGYLLILIIGAALLTAMTWHLPPPKPFVGIAGADVPRTLNGCTAAGNDPVPADVKAALASASLLSRTYISHSGSDSTATGGEPINFVLIGGTDRSALHDPRSCLIGAGMRLEDDHLEPLPGTSVTARSCHAVPDGGPVGAGTPGSDLLYLYVVDGKIINQATQIRAAMLWSALLGQQGKPVYFLRFERPINPDAGADARGHARLQEFATAMWRQLRPRLLASQKLTESMDVLSKIVIADTAFHNVTMEEAVARIVQMAQKTEKPRYVCTGNLDHLVMLSHDAEFREIYAGSDLTLADGKPVVLLSHLASHAGQPPLKQRVTGSDLFWELARASEATGLRLFFLGGRPCAADLARDAVLSRYPGAQICGTHCPPLATFGTEETQAEIREAVRAAQPDILLVGFGAPKQEKWIAANKDLLSVPVSIGVGGSFEMAGGVVRRAPVWMQDAGLEWAYRFLQEPTRLWERYFVRDLPFLVRMAGRTMAGRRAALKAVAVDADTSIS